MQDLVRSLVAAYFDELPTMIDFATTATYPRFSGNICSDFAQVFDAFDDITISHPRGNHAQERPKRAPVDSKKRKSVGMIELPPNKGFPIQGLFNQSFKSPFHESK